MLVLTRKRDEVIRVGENIVIRVIRTGKSTVKIGVDAPTTVKVTRGELAALLSPSDVISEMEEAAM